MRNKFTWLGLCALLITSTAFAVHFTNSSGASIGNFSKVSCGSNVTCAQSSGKLDISVVGLSSGFTGAITGDGGDALSGFLQSQVASTTVAITAAQCGSTFVSNSADVMTLPEASTVLGCRLTFVCGAAANFDINPADATDVIGTVVSVTGTNTTTVLAPAAGDAIRCAAIGASIVLEAVGADLWASVGAANGTWTDVN